MVLLSVARIGTVHVECVRGFVTSAMTEAACVHPAVLYELRCVNLTHEVHDPSTLSGVHTAPT
jgi:hypothetical protein